METSGSLGVSQIPVGGLPQSLIHLGNGGLPFHLHHHVDQRDVGGRHPHRQTVKLALQLGITRATAAAAPVLVGIMDRAAARARRRSEWGKSRMR